MNNPEKPAVMIRQLDHGDLLSETYAWTYGSCSVWASVTGSFVPAAGKDFEDFVRRTHEIVWRYMRGIQTLDGTCSDLECNLALKAVRIFGKHPI